MAICNEQMICKTLHTILTPFCDLDCDVYELLHSFNFICETEKRRVSTL